MNNELQLRISATAMLGRLGVWKTSCCWECQLTRVRKISMNNERAAENIGYRHVGKINMNKEPQLRISATTMLGRLGVWITSCSWENRLTHVRKIRYLVCTSIRNKNRKKGKRGKFKQTERTHASGRTILIFIWLFFEKGQKIHLRKGRRREWVYGHHCYMKNMRTVR
jgi:hypothetical protein